MYGCQRVADVWGTLSNWVETQKAAAPLSEAAAGKNRYGCKDFVVRICFPYLGNSRYCCKQFLPFFYIKGIIQMDSDKSLT